MPSGCKVSKPADHLGVTKGGLSTWDGGGVRGRPSEGGLDGFSLDLLRVVAMKLGKEQDKVIH